MLLYLGRDDVAGPPAWGWRLPLRHGGCGRHVTDAGAWLTSKNGNATANA
jgi:hypothetical protein